MHAPLCLINADTKNWRRLHTWQYRQAYLLIYCVGYCLHPTLRPVVFKDGSIGCAGTSQVTRACHETVAMFQRSQDIIDVVVQLPLPSTERWAA